MTGRSSVQSKAGTSGSSGRPCRHAYWTKSSDCTRSAVVAKVLLGVTGSVAAIKTPELWAALGQVGHDVKIVATQASLYFFDPVSIDPSCTERNPEHVILDADEWPGRDQGRLAQ